LQGIIGKPKSCHDNTATCDASATMQTGMKTGMNAMLSSRF
jgi:hypothetical protein